MFAAADALDTSTTRPTLIPFRDPIAMDLLEGQAKPTEVSPAALGSFPRQQGLGFAFTIPMIAKAIPTIVSIIRSVQGGGSAVTDPVSAVWQKIPPSAINAKEGADGWWYDLTTGNRLTHEEAALRQQGVVAASIGAHVGDDGYWVDNITNQTLSHSEAWARYQALSHSGTTTRPLFPAGGSTSAGAGGTGSGGTGATGTGLASAFGNIPPIVLIGVGVGLFLMLRKRRAA